MNELFIFVSSLFFLWVIRETFFWITFWQENEYRIDRFFASLKKRIRRPKFSSMVFFFGKWILFFSYIYVIFRDDLLIVYQYVLIGFYFTQAFIVLKEIYLNQLKKPRLTLRVNSVLLFTFITIFLFFAIPLADRFFWLLFLDLAVPFIILFYILLFLFPIEIYTDWQIEKAIRKIRAHKNVLVIAVTGSTGKSLTKDYLAEILSKKFQVIKTEGKNNTASGIARTILKKLTDDTEIFVAEISAYQQGEIRLLCELIRPRIGVLTAINNYHVSLFKSLDTIKKTNFELVESLPKQGFCLFAGNNKNTLGLYKKSGKAKVLYRILEKGVSKTTAVNEIVAYSLSQKQKRTTFTVLLNKQEYAFTTGKSIHIDQILPAIYVAASLGMTNYEIKRAIGLLK